MIGNRNGLNKYMRKKCFDEFHIDSAIDAEADIFLAKDFKLLKRIKSHPKLQKWLEGKIKVLTPSEFMQ